MVNKSSQAVSYLAGSILYLTMAAITTFNMLQASDKCLTNKAWYYTSLTNFGLVWSALFNHVGGGDTFSKKFVSWDLFFLFVIAVTSIIPAAVSLKCNDSEAETTWPILMGVEGVLAVIIFILTFRKAAS